jgi:hypothetical protein
MSPLVAVLVAQFHSKACCGKGNCALTRMPTVNMTAARFRGRHKSPSTSRKTRKGKVQLEVIRYDYCQAMAQSLVPTSKDHVPGRVSATHPIPDGLVRLTDDFVE